MQQSKDRIWNINSATEGRNDFDFYATDNNEYAIYFSSISEYSIMKFWSPVQIWKNKVDPKLIFDNREINFEYQSSESCYYLDRSDLIVLLIPCNGQDFFRLIYVLFDFNEERFSIIDAPNFRLEETDRGIVRFDIQLRYVYDDITIDNILKENGKLIDLAQLKWYDLAELNKICSIVLV